MLVISRKLAQKFTLTLPDGEVIVVTIVQASASNVRLGIDAPRNIVVSRNELLEEIPGYGSSY